MELTKAIADKEVRIWKTPRRPRRVRKGKARSPGNFGPKGRAGRFWLAADPSGHIGGDNPAGEGRRVRHSELSPYALLFPQLACGGKFFVWFGYEMRSGWTNVRVCASPRKLIHPYALAATKTMYARIYYLKSISPFTGGLEPSDFRAWWQPCASFSRFK
ncbi:hypothetical protein KFK09_003797 [Dendrobium nobile]|uniref:Uncharacterized protein n=1 Tax=Dendrobium nobile TaxID=94219 RepID=A0A8T3C4G6_DENNO|nr:hypothetical protein KFK09_003797 [Dendrobium nobile]